MTTTIKLTSPSPAEKAELIRRHFPALLPTFNPDTGNIEAPSMSEPNIRHTITKHQLADGTTEFHCDCKATRTCTHSLLAADVKPLGVVQPTVRIGMPDAEFDARYGSLMKSRASHGAIA